MSGNMFVRSVCVSLFLGCVSLSVAPVPAAQAASQVSAVVNNQAITSGDVAKRTNFLRLQRAKGNLPAMAKQQLIDEVLKRQEILRLKASVSTDDVDASFTRFATNNKMTVQQLTQILAKAGVGAEHFKGYIAVQMSWPKAVAMRYGTGGGKLTGQDLTERMLEKAKAGETIKTTEYYLKQMIFVVPEKKRASITGKRKAEAEASRKNFPGCDQAKVFAATMHDVSVRDLGRVMAPEMPPEWKPLVEKAAANGTTGTRVTEKGVEYLAICKQREVSDDVAAATVFRAEDIGKDSSGDDPNSKLYIEDLRKKARISDK